jgi:Peptidase family S51
MEVHQRTEPRTPMCELGLPTLCETVYVRLSAGSLVMAPNIGEDFVRWTPPTGGDEALGMVDFSMSPHLDHEDLLDSSTADAERWAAGMPVPAYAIDDQTAIKLTDGTSKSSPRGTGSCSPPRTESPATGVGRFRILVHPWVCNADIGCGAMTLRCASVRESPLSGDDPRSPTWSTTFARSNADA